MAIGPTSVVDVTRRYVHQWQEVVQRRNLPEATVQQACNRINQHLQRSLSPQAAQALRERLQAEQRSLAAESQTAPDNLPGVECGLSVVIYGSLQNSPEMLRSIIDP